jgi:SNF2 family DNA or RNA helicase
MKVSYFTSPDNTRKANLAAHFIRNGNSRMARAICDLHSLARWAVSGTPIQNRLGDLVSLLKFIRVYPYNDPQRFDTDISQVWKSGNDQNATKRLRRLSACLLLRRAKGTIELPLRRDFLLPIKLSNEERAIYDELREQTVRKMDEALGNETGTLRARCCITVLQQIESLRLFCNLGLHYRSSHEKNLYSADWNRDAQRTFNTQSEMNPITCLHCSSIFDTSASLLDDATTRQNPLFFSCLRFVCSECLGETKRASRDAKCGHHPSCPVATVSTSNIMMEEVPDLTFQAAPLNPFGSLPSKIQALITDIQTVPADIKW